MGNTHLRYLITNKPRRIKMAIKSKTKHTSAIKLAAISIIVLCVFAGCKDDEKPDPDPKPKIAQ